MTADGWTKAVRQQLGLGRVLPLGGPHDGAWITEAAAEAALRRGTATLPGLRLGRLRISPGDPGAARDEPETAAVPAPPSALPPGPLRISADFAALAGPAAEPFPAVAARLRAGLAATAGERLGLRVTGIDLRVTDLWEGEGGEETERGDGGTARPAPAPGSPPAGAPVPTGDDEVSRTAAAALSVPGVTYLTAVLGGPVHIGPGAALPRHPGPLTTGPALPRRHVRVELAVSEEGRALEVARAVRVAVGAALPDGPSAAVLVTAVDG